MKKIFILLLVFAGSCQKPEKNTEPVKIVSGVIPDDPAMVERVQLVVSSSYISAKGKPAGNYDNDKDGVINKNDKCPDVYGTDGYGCPVVAPPPTDTVQPPPPTQTGVVLHYPFLVGKQGDEGSCVAFATKAAREIELYYKTQSPVLLSAEHLFNRVKFGDNCYTGTAIEPALRFIRDTGICTNQSLPYSYTNGCSAAITYPYDSEAANYKISGFVKMYTTDEAAIKAMISNNHAVICGLLGDNSFINYSFGDIWKQYSGSGSLPHCVAIVGYDDTKHAYKIMNSWGAAWGDAGYCWIDYDFFTTRTGTYCYSIN